MPAIRRLALDRRTFLRGSATAMALPWLDAMRPALSPTPAQPRRALFIFSPNGVDMPRWRVDGEGPSAELNETLAALRPMQDRLTVLTRLAIDGGFSHGDGPGDHARAAGSFLTCAHPKKTAGADIHTGVSVDQWIAEHVGGETVLPSLELGMSRGRSAGSCDSGYSCAYSSNVSWRPPRRRRSRKRPTRARCSAGCSATPQSRPRRPRRACSGPAIGPCLDLVLADAKSLQRELGRQDRAKLDAYLQAVREFEVRLGKLDDEQPEVDLPDGLMSEDRTYQHRLGLMYEIIALAFASDSTRVCSFMLGNAGSNLSYRFLDVPEGHHNLSHHGKDAHKRKQIARIDRFQLERFTAFLQRLASETSGDGDLLSQSLVVWGSGYRRRQPPQPRRSARHPRGRGRWRREGPPARRVPAPHADGQSVSVDRARDGAHGRVVCGQHWSVAAGVEAARWPVSKGATVAGRR